MELLDIVDENNVLTGQVKERKKVHDECLWHRHVSSWIMNKKGEILLQRRAENKSRNPNRWAKTGGHVDSGEDVKIAIKREIKEEIGIDIPNEQIKVLSIYKSTEKDNKYFAYNFIFIVDYKIDEYILQKEEVAEVKYFTIEEMEKIKEDNNLDYTFCDWDDDKFLEDMNLLKEKRKEILEKVSN